MKTHKRKRESKPHINVVIQTVIFTFNEKGFPCKSLCSCVIILSLCWLKFTHSYIEFLPTHTSLSQLINFFSCFL